MSEDVKKLLIDAREIRDAIGKYLFKVERLKLPTEGWDSLAETNRFRLEGKLYPAVHYARELVDAIERGPFIKRRRKEEGRVRGKACKGRD